MKYSVKFIEAKRQGLLGFTGEVFRENRPMLHLFEKMGFKIKKKEVMKYMS